MNKLSLDDLIDNKKLNIIDNELCVRSTNRSMKGYIGQEHMAQRWVKTKDLVEIKGNRVVFIGRKDDVINIGGYKVSPHWVESEIRKLDGIKEVLSPLNHMNYLVTLSKPSFV